MKKLRAVVWRHPKGGPAALRMLERCDLRHLAEQEAWQWSPDGDEPEDAWLSGAFGYVRLLESDPRLPLLLAELEAVEADPTVRTEILYSAKERQTSPWLTFRNSTSMVVTDDDATPWNHDDACPACGAGALPSDRVVLSQWKMPKTGLAVSAPSGLLIATAAVAETIKAADLTGITVFPVFRGKKPKLDPTLKWLKIESTMPAWHRLTKYDGDLCSSCRRTGHYKGDHWHGIWYAAYPNGMFDFNLTREQIGDSGHSTPKEPATGGAPFIIFSQRAREVLAHAGVKLQVEPVYLTPAKAKPS